MADPFNQYDVVCIVAISDPMILSNAHPYQRIPRIGDRATIVDIYNSPAGYELECCDSDGKTIWLGSFLPDDLQLERVWSAPPP